MTDTTPTNLLTGEDYRASLDDGRAVYFEGERIADLASHPILGPCVDRVAAGYDLLREKAIDGVSPIMRVPTTPDEVYATKHIGREAGSSAGLTFNCIMTLSTVAAQLPPGDPFAENITSFLTEFRQRNHRMSECITDAKGDRSRRPGEQTDLDSYVRVVDRSSDGVVIRGAKLHISGASLGHELMVIPTKAMRTGEEAFAVAAAVPVSAPGVKMVDTAAAPKTDPRTSPISTPRYYPDSLVILDDVFVPKERLFLDGETGKAHIFAHALGLWERLGGLRGLADDADAMVGFAQLIAEANGLTRIAHVKEKIAEMMAHATLIRATLEAAQANSVVHESGAILADELYVNAGKYYAAAHSYEIIRHLQDIAGGSVMTAPSALDLENDDIGDLIRKYMAGADGYDGEYRTALFHAIRDLTADRYGGWKAVGNLQGGGGLYAQRIVIRKHYDLDAAKRAALSLAGVTTP